MSVRTKKLLAVGLLLVFVLGAAAAYLVFRPRAQAGGKTVAFTVTHADASVHEFTLCSDAETLGQLLKENALVEGEEGPYGIFVSAVDGESVDSAKEEWWNFTKDGEMLMTGIDDTVIADGEHYEAVFTVGYDVF